MPVSFFDTNVLVYVASGDATKADRAEKVIAAGGAINVQVLNELTNVARRKMKMSWPDTYAFLDMLRGLLTVHPLTLDIHETGLELAERYGFSTYDAMIAAVRVDDPGKLADTIAAHLLVGVDEKQNLLEIISPIEAFLPPT